MSAHPIPFTLTIAGAVRAPVTFSVDRVLACGPSAAWLDAGQMAPSSLRAAPRPAPITGFIEAG